MATIENLISSRSTHRLAKATGLAKLKFFLIKREIESQQKDLSLNSKNSKRLAVFPNIGVVYNRIQKNANTTTMLILDKYETGEIRSIEQSKGQYDIVFRAAIRGEFSLQDARYMTVTRSPLSRTLSAFLYKFSVQRDFALRKYGRSFEVSSSGFFEFLCWLKDGALTKDPHWDLQVNSLALPIDLFTAFIRTESYNKDMIQFLSQQNIYTSENELKLIKNLGSPHKTKSEESFADFYKKKSTKLVESIYEKDFHLFNY